MTSKLWLMSPRPATILGSLLFAASALSQAQSPESEGTNERWYQVEVIAFAQQQPNSSEIWYNNPSLHYPELWQTLKDADEPVKLPGDAESISSGEHPEFVRQGLNVGVTQLASAGDNLLLAEASRAADLARDPFYRLPEDMRELNPQAQAIRWSKAYRLLFHEAWRQPVNSQAEAPGILISGGEQYGDHFELEGSLTLSVSRYLHANANLWFTEFAMNNGQQEDYWPELPLRPDAMQISHPESTLSLEQSGQEDLETAKALTVASGKAGEHASQTSGAPIDLLLSQLPGDEAYERLINQPFKPRQIVLMQQKRRMRSGETHYIDHPYIGVLILVTPYDVPDAIDSETASESTGQPALMTAKSLR